MPWHETATELQVECSQPLLTPRILTAELGVRRKLGPAVQLYESKSEFGMGQGPGFLGSIGNRRVLECDRRRTEL